MKNAMKKLTSLLLVALLLVGMIPFAASAEEATPTILVHLNGNACAPINGGTSIDLAGAAQVAGVDPSTVTDASAKKHNGDWVSLMNGGSLAVDEPIVYYVYLKAEPVQEPTPEPNPQPQPDPQPQPQPESKPATYDLSIDVDGVLKAVTNGTTASYEDCLALAGVDTSKVKVTEAVYQYTAADGRIPNYNFGPGDVITLTAPTRVFLFTEAKGQSNGSTGSTGSTNSSDTWTVTFRDVNNQVIREVKVANGGNISADDLTLASMGAGSLSGHTFSGWYMGTVAYSNAQLKGYPVLGNMTLTASFSPNANKLNNYQVYLHIYKNNMIGSPDKQLNITTGLALDGVVTLNEVKSLVMNYYGANNSYGIGFDGLYPGYGDWALSYITNQKYSELSVKEADRTSDVVIKVMITNAYTKGSGTADKSNPKTGDSIYTAMTVMGVSAVALASVMYFYNKKRMAL